MTTEELLQRCIGKDTAAWDEFIRRYESLVTRSVSYKLNKLGRHLPKNETRDIVQEIFLLIWEKGKLSGVKNTACLKSWLVIVSVNATSNYCRRHLFKTGNNTFSLDERPFPESPDITLGSLLPSAKLDTAKTLESNELGKILKKEISKLGYRKRLSLKLNIYDGKKQKDIAQIMNIPEGTVATLISRAKNQLRKNLKDILEM
jgi:RNA polymerase sigma-70 factor (ECF subfamily)